MAKVSKAEQRSKRRKSKSSKSDHKSRRPMQKGKVTKQVAQSNSTVEDQKFLEQKKFDELRKMNPNDCVHNTRDIARKWAKMEIRRRQQQAGTSNQGEFTTNKFANLKKVLRLEA